MKRFMSCIIACVIMVSCFVPVAFASDLGYSYGEPVKYKPTITQTHTELSLTSWEDGRPIVMVSANGSGLTVTSIVDINKQEVIHEFHHTWGGYAYNGCVSDDGVMYWGSGSMIAKYDPRTKELSEFCYPKIWEHAGLGGLIIDNERECLFMTDTNYGHVIRIEEATGEQRVLADMSKIGWVTGTDIGQVGDYLYTSGNWLKDEGTANLWKIHKDTGEVTKIPNFDDKEYKSISECKDIGKYVYATFSTKDGTYSKAHVYDTEKEEWTDVTFNYKQSMTSEIHDGKRAFLWDNYIHTIDENLNIEHYPDLKYTSYFRGTGPWVELDDPELPGFSFLTAQFNGNIYIYNLNATEVKKVNVTLTGTPLPHRISYVNPADDLLYIGGYKAAIGVAYDTKTGEMKNFPCDQPEGMTHDPETGIFYHGDYSGALIRSVDSSKPMENKNYKFGEDAGTIDFGSLGHEQDRPFDLEVVGRELYVATQPYSSALGGGALSWVNLDTGEMTVKQDIIPMHSLITITEKDGIVYGTTSVTRGTAATVAKEPAKIYAFDTKTKELIKVVDFVVDGVKGNISSVHALEWTPDGERLFGWTHGIFFELDPETLLVKKANVYGQVYTDAKDGDQLWHEKKIYFDESGYMIMDGKAIDLETLEVVVEAPTLDGKSLGFFAGFDQRGNAWFVGSDTSPSMVPVYRTKKTDEIYFKTGDDKIYVNGEVKPFASYMENGVTMVAMRKLAEIIGGSVGYIHPERLATLTNAGGKMLSYYTRDGKVLIDGNDAGFNMTAKDGVTFIPFERMCEFLGRTPVVKDGLNYVE